jgi:hypothetical protein
MISPKLLELLDGDFHDAAVRCKKAAASSGAAGKNTRARVRRERVTTQNSSGLPRIHPKSEEVKMPAAWRDDEITRKITVPKE